MKEPRPLDEALDKVLGDLGVARPLDTVELMAHWDELVGEPWAGRSRPVVLEQGVLVIEVTDPIAASLLRYRREALISHLADHLGAGLVTSVQLRRARPQP